MSVDFDNISKIKVQLTLWHWNDNDNGLTLFSLGKERQLSQLLFILLADCADLTSQWEAVFAILMLVFITSQWEAFLKMFFVLLSLLLSSDASQPNKKWSLTVAQTCLFCNEVLLSQSGTTCSKIQCVIFQDFSWQIDFHNHFTISNYAKKQVQSQALGEPDLFIAISSSFQFKNINIHKVLE